MTTLPSLYISHGSPMTALHPGKVGERLAELAASLPRPKAIVIATALFLISDIDSPRRGIIRVHPQNLESLRAGMK